MLPPEEIINDRARGLLEIVWQDALRQQFSHALLRAGCKCADCKALRLRSSEPLQVADAIRLEDLQPVGAYAVRLLFSDGHERGIYPWEYLREWGSESVAGPDCAIGGSGQNRAAP